MPNLSGERRRNLLRVYSFLTLVALSGCAITDTGAIDYRRAELPKPNASQARLMLPHKNEAPKSEVVLLRKGDSVSIRLQQGFVRHCTDPFIDPFDGLTDRNCEVAVVIRAFEMNGEEGNDFDFSPEGVDQGRLVYYSNDVEQDQFLNFNNMPIYGPITYNGGPIGLDIFVLEIDAEDEQAKAILKQLSSLGSTAYAPASPVLEVLNSLGTALISSGSDDVDFRYTFLLDPNGITGRDENGLSYARLAAGDYVLVREEDRRQKTPWNELRYDANLGRLYHKEQKNWYRDNSYLSLQVNKNLSAVNIDLSQNTFGKFRQKLREADEARAEALSGSGEAIKQQIDEMIVARAQIRNFDQARQTIRAIKAARASDDTTEKLQASGAAFDLIRDVAEAIAALSPGDGAPTEDTADDSGEAAADAAAFSTEQIDYILRELRNAAKVGSVAEFELFTKENFTPEKVKTNLEMLVNLLVPLDAGND